MRHDSSLTVGGQVGNKSELSLGLKKIRFMCTGLACTKPQNVYEEKSFSKRCVNIFSVILIMKKKV